MASGAPSTELKTTDPSEIPGIVSKLRDSFNSKITLSKQWRLQQLHQLEKLLKEGEEELSKAMYTDLHRSRFESYFIELNIVTHEIHTAIENLDEWMKPEVKPTNLQNLPGKSFVQRDPLGVVLIMSPWNYPVQLLLAPLVGALAAGNTVLLRPASYTKNVSAALARLVAKYFDPSVVAIVTGDRDVTTSVLKERYDYIFFTGGPTLGRVVHQAANKHLTPVTLELGGKSPSYVDKSVDVDICAKRLTWATFVNAGQTCVRPDYLLVHEAVADEFIAAIVKYTRKFYADCPKADPNEYALSPAERAVAAEIKHEAGQTPYFGRIVDGGDAIDRLANILKQDASYIIEGGAVDKSKRFISPTLLKFGANRHAFENSAAMQAEIFGPILPILTVKSPEEAIALIRSREKPLALYCFSNDSSVVKRFLRETTSGSVAINDAIVQLANHELPFGGVGLSGMGAYHGRYSFETFSHQKAVMWKSTTADIAHRYPPYTEFGRKLIKLTGKPISRSTIRAVATVAAVTAAFLARNRAQDAVAALVPHIPKILPVIAAIAAYRWF